MRAAAELLTEGGRDAVSTRAVSSAAGVQAPTIYRLFGDKQGLLDAVASFGFADYLESKTSRKRAQDSVEDLRHGWNLHVDFGVANPALYTLMYGDPRPGAEPSAAREAAEILHQLVLRVARAGRLRVGIELAAQMIHSAGCGVTLTLIATPEADRDPALSERAREAVIAAITTRQPAGRRREGAQGIGTHAVALKAVLDEGGTSLTAAELSVLAEWLDRIVAAQG